MNSLSVLVLSSNVSILFLGQVIKKFSLYSVLFICSGLHLFVHMFPVLLFLTLFVTLRTLLIFRLMKQFSVRENLAGLDGDLFL